jgi:D-alanyl-D-alanine carboxypeptidase (penicillin-binding protein 5/6)
MPIEFVSSSGARQRRRQRRSTAAPSGGVPARVVWALVLLAALIVAYVAFALLRSLPGARATAPARSTTLSGPPLKLHWPAVGEAAIGVSGGGLIGSHGAQVPVPIASVAKIMAAYLILRRHPLSAGASGPLITITPADVAVYDADLAAGQSVMKVRAGERLSERQALEGLLLPSGNNIATLLADWDAGSQAAFLTQENDEARRLGLTGTHYTSVSGVRASTVSTAVDQTRLAALAMQIPTFRHIVAMPQVTLPVAGLQYNVNALLGTDGIVGIKTGSTSQAGGCLVFAADRQVAGRRVLVVGAVLGQQATKAQPSILYAAFDATKALLSGVGGDLVRRTVLARGSRLGYIKVPWRPRIPILAASSVSLLGWRGLTVRTVSTLPRRLPDSLRAGERIGTATVSAGSQRASVALLAGGALGSPSIGWRLTHP